MSHDLELFRRLRTENTHSLLPRTVMDVMLEYRRQRSGAVQAYEAKVVALGLDLAYNPRIKPYGGYVSNLTLDSEVVRKSGFDPEHLTAKVKVAYDDFHESALETAENCGYRVEKSDGEESRPSHESVEVDYSGAGERSSKRWVTVGYREEKHFLDGPAWKGMARGVRTQVRHERLKGASEQMAKHMSDYANDRIKSFNVTVTLYWRGEEVASDGMGGCEMEDDGRSMGRNVAAFILDYGLHGNALHEAERWADTAVSDAQARAARIVQEIALLPERSIEVVRGQFRTATVTDIRKEA